MLFVMLPLLFAASLNITSPYVVTPNRRNIVAIKGSAALSNSEPGIYKVTAHFPVSKEQEKSVGEQIESARINPPKIRLKDNKSRRFVANIPVGDDYTGLVFLCIVTDKPTASAGLVLVSRSCYANKVSR